jgi:hypothetical protein
VRARSPCRHELSRRALPLVVLRPSAERRWHRKHKAPTAAGCCLRGRRAGALQAGLHCSCLLVVCACPRRQWPAPCARERVENTHCARDCK